MTDHGTPGTVDGVPAEAVLLNVAAVCLFGTIAGSVLWWALAILMHHVMVLHNRHNPALYVRIAALVRRHAYLSTCGGTSFCLPLTLACIAAAVLGGTLR